MSRFYGILAVVGWAWTFFVGGFLLVALRAKPSASVPEATGAREGEA